jgi:catalase
LRVLARAIKLEAPDLALASLDDSNVVTSYGVVTVGKYSVTTAAQDALEIAAGGDKGFLSNFAFELSKHRCYEREMDGLSTLVAF